MLRWIVLVCALWLPGTANAQACSASVYVGDYDEATGMQAYYIEYTYDGSREEDRIIISVDTIMGNTAERYGFAILEVLGAKAGTFMAEDKSRSPGRVTTATVMEVLCI